jgi:hypothetical protein
MREPNVTIGQRRTIEQRAGGRCEYCRSPVDHSPDPFSVEHIHPRALRGSNSLDNLAFSCQGCNLAKSVKIEAIDPESGESVSLFHPRQHRWAAHFAWSEDQIQVIGLTAIGRASIIALRLNRVGVVNLRSVLRLAGKHPPEENE